MTLDQCNENLIIGLLSLIQEMTYHQLRKYSLSLQRNTVGMLKLVNPNLAK